MFKLSSVLLQYCCLDVYEFLKPLQGLLNFEAVQNSGERKKNQIYEILFT